MHRDHDLRQRARRAAAALELLRQRLRRDRLQVRGSMSTKSTVGAAIARAVGRGDEACSGWSRRASPGPSAERQAGEVQRRGRAVDRDRVRAPDLRARRLSNAGTAGPCVRKSERSTSTTASMSASVMSWRP